MNPCSHPDKRRCSSICIPPGPSLFPAPRNAPRSTFRIPESGVIHSVVIPASLARTACLRRRASPMVTLATNRSLLMIVASHPVCRFDLHRFYSILFSPRRNPRGPYAARSPYGCYVRPVIGIESVWNPRRRPGKRLPKQLSRRLKTPASRQPCHRALSDTGRELRPCTNLLQQQRRRTIGECMQRILIH